MATNSNRPASNPPDPHSSDPIQPPSGGLNGSSEAARLSSQPGDLQSGNQPSDQPNGQASSQPSAAKLPTAASSQPPLNQAADSTFNVSSVRRTTPARTTPAQTTPARTTPAKQKTKPKIQKSVVSTANRSLQVRIPLFFAVGLGLSLLAAGLKAIAALLAENYLYSLPWVGGFLRSIELAELSNLVAFSILAGGIGAATIWLPHRWNPWAKAALLLAVSPFVFSASYLMQQRLWVQRVAERSNVSYPEAEQITNDFLERETGSRGFFGFYPYSTEVADLPTSRASLERQTAGNPSQLLTRELASYEDPRADLVAYIFERVGWLLRLMYMAIAALTALIYYCKGRDWAENRRVASYNQTNSAQTK